MVEHKYDTSDMICAHDMSICNIYVLVCTYASCSLQLKDLGIQSHFHSLTIESNYRYLLDEDELKEGRRRRSELQDPPCTSMQQFGHRHQVDQMYKSIMEM